MRATRALPTYSHTCASIVSYMALLERPVPTLSCWGGAVSRERPRLRENACLLQYGFTRTRYWLYDFSGTCTEHRLQLGTVVCRACARATRLLRARAQLSVRVRSCVGGEHWRTSKRNTETCRRILVANSPRNRWHSAKHTGRHSARPLSCPWTPWAGRSAPSSRTGSC